MASASTRLTAAGGSKTSWRSALTAYCTSCWNRKRHVAFAVILTATALYSSAFVAPESYLPQSVEARGISMEVVWLNPVFAFLGSIVLGYIQPKIGLRFTMVSGLSMIGGSTLLMSFLMDLPGNTAFIIVFIVLASVQGLGIGIYMTAVYTSITYLFPNTTGTAKGLVDFSFGFGLVIGRLLGVGLYAAGGFRCPYLVIGIIILLFTPVLHMVLPNMETKRRLLSFKVSMKFSASIPFSANVIAQILTMLFFPIFVPFLPFILATKFGLTPVQISAVILTNSVAYFMTAMCSGVLVDRLKPGIVLHTGGIIASLAAFLIGSNWSYLWLTVVSYGAITMGAAAAMVSSYVSLLQLISARKIDSESNEALNAFVAGVSNSSYLTGGVAGVAVGRSLDGLYNVQSISTIIGELILGATLLMIGIDLVDKLFPLQDQLLPDCTRKDTE